jgi:hypothetical protein
MFEIYHFDGATPLSSDARLTASLPESALILTAGLSSLPFFLISLPFLETATVSPSFTSRTLPLGSERDTEESHRQNANRMMAQRGIFWGKAC